MKTLLTDLFRVLTNYLDEEVYEDKQKNQKNDKADEEEALFCLFVFSINGIFCVRLHLISSFLTPFKSAFAGTIAIAPLVEATNATSDAASPILSGCCPRPENTMRCQNVLK